MSCYLIEFWLNVLYVSITLSDYATALSIWGALNTCEMHLFKKITKLSDRALSIIAMSEILFEPKASYLNLLHSQATVLKRLMMQKLLIIFWQSLSSKRN